MVDLMHVDERDEPQGPYPSEPFSDSHRVLSLLQEVWQVKGLHYPENLHTLQVLVRDLQSRMNRIASWMFSSDYVEPSEERKQEEHDADTFLLTRCLVPLLAADTEGIGEDGGPTDPYEVLGVVSDEVQRRVGAWYHREYPHGQL